MGLTQILCFALTIYWIILIIRIALSWIPSLPDPVRPLARGVSAVTDPLLNPLRGLLPPLQTGAVALDLSPILLFFGIYLVRSLLCA